MCVKLDYSCSKIGIGLACIVTHCETI